MYLLLVRARHKCRLRSTIDIILQIAPDTTQRLTQNILKNFSKGAKPNETIFCFYEFNKLGLNFTDAVLNIYNCVFLPELQSN